MRHLSHAIALVAILVATAGARAEEPDGCGSPDPERRIAPCTALIEAPGTAPAERAEAYFRRGLSYAELGQNQRAIPDYGEAIRIAPRFAAALNNRADAWLKLGKPAQGVADIEKALEIDPQHPAFNATRGEIRQALGDPDGAMRDHEAAMAFGGRFFVQLYQCSLRLAQLYHGAVDGVLRPELLTALRLCVDRGSRCAPLPPSQVPECAAPAV